MTDNICNVFCYLFEAFTCRMYFESFYSPKRSKRFIFFAYTISFLIQYALNFLDILALNVVEFIVFYTVICFVCYESKLKSAVFSGAMLMVMMFLTELIVMHLSSHILGLDLLEFRENFFIFFTQGLLSKLLFFTVVFLVSKYFKKRDKLNQYDKFSGLLAILPVTTFVMLYALDNFVIRHNLDESYNSLLFICSLLLLLANLSVFYINEILQRNHRRITELSLEQQKSRLTNEYYELAADSGNRQRILIHDIKKHLRHIDNKLKNGETAAAEEYIAEIISDFGLESNSAAEFSGNETVDAIISRYSGLCKAKGIDLSLDIHPCKLNGISDTDLVALLDNMFENAIEATEISAGKRIHFSLIVRNSNYAVIVLENSCDKRPQESNGRLVSAKKDPEAHGIGMRSIKRVVDKYNGKLDWSYNDVSHSFKVAAVLEENKHETER